ncbi:MAG: class I SAM-dependent methyltransferase [Armatimonadetes bacterium]|nr:class I SAM-dependent methyltransferase [Armatimonadota bacterium]
MDQHAISEAITTVLRDYVEQQHQLSFAVLEQMMALAKLLATDAHKLGLTGYSTAPEVVRGLIAPSLIALRWLSPEERLEVLEIGAGSGAVGLTLAIVAPRWRVVLVDRRQRGVSFCDIAALRLGLNNVTARVADARKPQARAVSADAVLLRAVAPPAQDLAMAENFTARKGRAIIWSASGTDWPEREGWKRLEALSLPGEGPSVAAYERIPAL